MRIRNFVRRDSIIEIKLWTKAYQKVIKATAHYPSSEVPGPCLGGERPVKLTHAAVYLVDLPKS